MELPPLSLYVHFPWCVKKCPYCDFNSHSTSHIPQQDYLSALKKDLESELPFVQGRKLESIFFGGGTPSLASEKLVSEIIELAENKIGLQANCEITLEANPGTTDASRFKAYQAGGVNRMSLGAQSFNGQQLEKLGRIHQSDDIAKAVEAVSAAGITNFNLDLMFALPDQSLDEALQDIQQAMALKPNHISWYQLTIEPNTVFYNAPPTLPNEDKQFEFMQAGKKLLADKGYEQYETSAYSQPNQQSKHNLNYWEFGDYLGIGAGAHGKLSFIQQDQLIVKRRQKIRMPESYMNSVSPCCLESELDQPELISEYMMNALRLTNGAPKSYFQQRTGLSFDTIEFQVNDLTEKGLLEMKGKNLAPTQRGSELLNNILEVFI